MYKYYKVPSEKRDRYFFEYLGEPGTYGEILFWTVGLVEDATPTARYEFEECRLKNLLVEISKGEIDKVLILKELTS